MLVISHGAVSGENAHDALQAAMHDLSVPIPADADAETLEARRLALITEVLCLHGCHHIFCAFLARYQ